MNLLKPLCAASLIFAVGAVYAQASKFNGAFGQVGIGYESVTASSPSGSLSVNGLSVNANPTFSTSNSFAGTAALGWYQDITKGYLLGFGVEYSPIAGTSTTQNVSATIKLANQNHVSNSYTFQKKNSYNIFISPAMMVGDDGLAYAKIGYTGAQVTEYSSLTYNFTGYSLGLGYKQIFYGSWYGFAEANYSSYGSQTQSATNPIGGGRTLTASGTNGLTSYNGLVGIGYKF